MAGITAMGDLSHELESLVIQIDGGSVAADDHAHSIMQASLDELARMRDMVSAGTLPSAPTGLLARIRGLASGAQTAVPDAAPASAASAATAGSRDFRSGARRAAAAPAPAPAPAIAVAKEDVSPAAAPAPLAEESAPALSEDSVSQLEVSSGPVLPGRESAPAERVEMARVDAELLDTMLNNAGEVSIFRSRLDQQVNSIDFNLAELARTVTRLKEQLRGLEIETEAQVLNRHQEEDSRRDDFDPLELDRYSALQQYSRALAETSGDVASIQGLLETLTREAQNLLTQQARVITELQNSLMRTRMVPFQRHVQRLTRLVRQAANDTGKRAELVVQGASAELDRQMLERMVAPLEHMLRNAVVHGIESARAAHRARQAGRRAHIRQPDARRRRGRDRGHRRWRRHQRETDPRKGDRAGAYRPPVEAHRRRGHAAHPGARLQHRRARHSGGRPRRRHGRRGHRGQEARRRPVHRIESGQGVALHASACRSRSRSARR